MTSRLQSLRKRTWSADPKDAMREIGEALRDLHGFVSKLTLGTLVEVNGVVWSEPFAIGLDLVPRVVFVADARIAGTLQSVNAGVLPDWQLDVSSTGPRARINRVVNLDPGKSYDLKFWVVF